MDTTTAINNTTTVDDVDLWACDAPTPSARELREKISLLGVKVIVPMVIPGVLFFIMVIMFIEEVIFLKRNTVRWKVTAYKIWILSAYPVLSFLSLLNLFMPRTADIISFTISFYFVVVIKKYFSYVLYLYGGKHGMVEAFKYKETVNATPFPCCYCFWFKRGPLTMKRLHMLQALMYHGLVFYPFLNFLETLLKEEDIGDSLGAVLTYAAIGFAGTLSNFVCLYSLSIINKASRPPLEQFYIRGKYQSIQGIIIFNTIQGACVRLCGLIQIIPCGFPYPEQNPANILQSWLLIVELFLLSLLARRGYRRTDNDAKVIPYPFVDAYGEALPVTAIKMQPTSYRSGKIKHLSAVSSLVTVYPYPFVDDGSDEYRVQIESISSSIHKHYFDNECFIPDF